jgi:hypothetical protein
VVHIRRLAKGPAKGPVSEEEAVMRFTIRLRRAALVLGAVAAFIAPAALPATAAARHCPSGYVHAVIGGEQKCLHAGEFCSASERRQYPRYGFKCVRVHGYWRLES